MWASVELGGISAEPLKPGVSLQSTTWGWEWSSLGVATCKDGRKKIKRKRGDVRGISRANK